MEALTGGQLRNIMNPTYLSVGGGIIINLIINYLDYESSKYKSTKQLRGVRENYP